jgi:glucose-1-phosphate thymidylyltransferase
MKGIILAGGSGTRLFPVTSVISKQLLPIYDKPMIYYPLSILMLAEIRDILIISTEQDIPKFRALLGNGDYFGCNFEYVVQPSPDGLAQAFILGADFIGNDDVCMVLGDNIFYGNGLRKKLLNARENTKRKISTIFGYFVEDPQRFGVMEFDENLNVVSLEEKPNNPKSNYAITGLYFYDNSVVNYAKKVEKSARGEYEITDLNKLYLLENRLHAETLGRGFAWLDTGTTKSMFEAANFVKTIQESQGLKISCPEEIAYLNKWITYDQLEEKAKLMSKNDYGKHLRSVLEGKVIY